MDTSTSLARASYTLHIKSGQLVWANNSFTFFGYPPTEPANELNWWIDHIHPEDALLINDELDRLFDPTVSAWITSYRFQKADGNYVVVQDAVTIHRDAIGDAESLDGVLSLV